jgi:hypothetical protein
MDKRLKLFGIINPSGRPIRIFTDAPAVPSIGIYHLLQGVVEKADNLLDRCIRSSKKTTAQPNGSTDLSRTIPYWFLAFVGLIYASGFLVVSSFLETFGIRDAGADLWKTRYIHIGVFCLMATVIPNAVTYLLSRLLPIHDKDAVADPLPYKPLRALSTVIIYIVSLLSKTSLKRLFETG